MMANEKTTGSYSVKQLAGLAGVSVRTLHLYDELGLLKPAMRTSSGYRKYGEKELLRLQQILFYKELDFPLQDIISILNNPEFDILQALEGHQKIIFSRRERLSKLLLTIGKTIQKLKNGTTMKHEELYEGFSPESRQKIREEAIKNYGSDAIERSETYLSTLGKGGVIRLKEELDALTSELAEERFNDPSGDKVQHLIRRHYEVIRKLWGTHGSDDLQASAYAGLGELYVSDPRFTPIHGKENPEFATFLQKAMKHFTETL